VLRSWSNAAPIVVAKTKSLVTRAFNLALTSEVAGRGEMNSSAITTLRIRLRTCLPCDAVTIDGAIMPDLDTRTEILYGGQNPRVVEKHSTAVD
jgi:hypothetical protein